MSRVPGPSLLALATHPEDRDDARLIEVGPGVARAEKAEQRQADTRPRR